MPAPALVWLLACVCPVGGALAAPPVATEPTRLAYTLDATLEPAEHRVIGSGEIRFVNTSKAPLTALELHLYANAFANGKTTFMRQGGERLRGVPLSRHGQITLDQLSIANGTELLPQAQLGPDEHDHTQLRVPLPRPLAPGDELRLRVRFRVQLPSLTARMGQSGDFAMVAQWFPKLARLERDGRWSQHPYYGLGEFSADFADYDVTLRVPVDHLIAAAGKRIASAVDSGQRVERYRLDRVLDFAWAASPALRRTTFSAPGVAAVDVYAPAGQQWLARRQGRLLADGLAQLQGLLGPYPHDRLVLILPPPHARGAAGMEYPGLVVGWLAHWRSAFDPALRIAQDFVSAHELAHQWFPMLVASHEAREPVLDEGLAQWVGMHALRRRYGRHSRWPRVLGLPVDQFDVQRALWARSGANKSSLEPAWHYALAELGASVYQRPALLLESVRRAWGAARFDRAIGDYARAHRHSQVTRAQLCAAFDRAYWPGFCATQLLPALRGEDPRWQLPTSAKPSVAGARAWTHAAPGWEDDPHLQHLLIRDRRLQQARVDPDAPHPAWLSRIVYIAQWLLSWVGA